MMVTNCPDNLEKVWMIWKLSGQSRDCLDNLETVRPIHEMPLLFKNSPDNPETVWIISKLSQQYVLGVSETAKKDQGRSIYTKADQGRLKQNNAHQGRPRQTMAEQL